jgi:hypothetical protein
MKQNVWELEDLSCFCYLKIRDPGIQTCFLNSRTEKKILLVHNSQQQKYSKNSNFFIEALEFRIVNFRVTKVCDSRVGGCLMMIIFAK